jgi:hypothetical protein
MEFVLGIIAISTFGWLANNWIRARHGYDLEDEWGGKTPTGDSNAAQTLAARVDRLSEEIDHYRDRVRVLERIVTDNGFVTAAQIEALRDEPQGSRLSVSGKLERNA